MSHSGRPRVRQGCAHSALCRLKCRQLAHAISSMDTRPPSCGTREGWGGLGCAGDAYSQGEHRGNSDLSRSLYLLQKQKWKVKVHKLRKTASNRVLRDEQTHFM